MSIADEILADSIDSFNEVLAERDPSDGSLKTITVISGDGTETEVLVAVLGNVTETITVGASGVGLQRRETTTAVVKTELLVAAGLDSPHIAYQVRLPDATEWAIDTSTTVWGKKLVTLGLSRKILLRKQEARRADI